MIDGRDLNFETVLAPESAREIGKPSLYAIHLARRWVKD
jgi:hypothetical protein